MNEELFDKKQNEEFNRQKELNKFNSITQSVKPVNQNQQHNSRREGIDPSIIQKR